MDSVSIRGKQYVKATKAARDFGYAIDYVGQLARSGAVPAERIGRSWYVDADALRDHKTEKNRSVRERARASLVKRVAVHTQREHFDPDAAYARYVGEVAYEADDAPSLPHLTKRPQTTVRDGLLQGVNSVLARSDPAEVALSVSSQDSEEFYPEDSETTTREHEVNTGGYDTPGDAHFVPVRIMQEHGPRIEPRGNVLSQRSTNETMFSGTAGGGVNRLSTKKTIRPVADVLLKPSLNRRRVVRPPWITACLCAVLLIVLPPLAIVEEQTRITDTTMTTLYRLDVYRFGRVWKEIKINQTPHGYGSSSN